MVAVVVGRLQARTGPRFPRALYATSNFCIILEIKEKERKSMEWVNSLKAKEEDPKRHAR